MKHSSLLSTLLARAKQLGEEAGVKHLSAPCILVAVSALCATAYTGLTPYDNDRFPEMYEEERLRYLYKQVFRSTASLTGRILKRRLTGELRRYDTDFFAAYTPFLETETAYRGKDILTADLVFLTAVQALDAPDRLGASPSYRTVFSVRDALEDVDAHIYDFVIGEIAVLRQRLQTKADEAAAKRDWRPAAKFIDPEELPTLLLTSASTVYADNTLELTLPFFFAAQDGALHLSIRRTGGVYTVCDNGCALTQLKRHTGTAFSSVLQAIRKNLSLESNGIIGAFSQPHAFFHYLQTLIFVANADLYHGELSEDGLYCDPDLTFATVGEPFDAGDLLDQLKRRIQGRYDEHIGLYLSIAMTYSLNSTTVSYRIEALDDGTLRISDNCHGQTEGEIFESFYWTDRSLHSYRDYIGRFCDRFGADFDGQAISLRTNGDLAPAMFRFIGLAVLLSEFGRLIELPQNT